MKISFGKKEASPEWLTPISSSRNQFKGLNIL